MEKTKKIRKSIITSEDVLEEIFMYLPLKSLARFKTLSKKWNSTIESTYFSHNRLVRSGSSTPNMKLLVVHQTSLKFKEDLKSTTLILKTFTKNPDNNKEICMSSSSSYTFPDNPISGSQDKPIQILGSCDGLVWVVINEDFRYIYLINPTTREHRTLSPEPSQFPNHTHITTMPFSAGFGKDIVTRSYKVILMYHIDYILSRFKMKLLSIDTGEQRDVDIYSLDPYNICYEEPPVYTNGSLFWWTISWELQKHSQLLAIDLHTEKNRWISLPNCYSKYSSSIQMWSLNECVCLSDVRECPHLDVWSLQQEIPDPKWEKIYSLDVLSVDHLMLRLRASYFHKIKKNRDKKVLYDRLRTTVLYSPTMISPMKLLC